MYKILLFCIGLMFCDQAISQTTENNPRILMVSPGSFYADESFIPELRVMLNSAGLQIGEESEWKDQPENIQRSLKSVVNYTKTMDVFGLVPLSVAGRLLFTMFRGKRDFVFLMDTIKVYGTANELSALAKEKDVQHIVFFPEIKLYKDDSVGYISMEMAVYDATTNKISLSYNDEIDWDVESEYENPEYTDEKSAAGLIHNMTLAHKSHLILETVAFTNPAYKELEKKRIVENLQEKDEFRDIYFDDEGLSKKAFQQIILNYLPASCNVGPIEKIIENSGIENRTNSIYQILYNQDSSRFAAFVVDTIKSDFFRLNGNPTEKMFFDFNFDQTDVKPNSKEKLYGTVIRGLKENEKWFVDEWTCEEFKSKNIQNCRKILLCNLDFWHFFDAESISLNQEFWLEDEYGLFRYGEEHEFGTPYLYEYIVPWTEDGLYSSFGYITEVEANQYVREIKNFEADFSKNLLANFWQSHSETLESLKNTPLVYSANRKIVIFPAIEKSEHKSNIGYYVYLEKSGLFYKWNYPDFEKMTEKIFDQEKYYSQYNSFTAFFLEGFPVIQDPRFFTNFVFKLNGDEWIYLQPVID